MRICLNFSKLFGGLLLLMVIGSELSIFYSCLSGFWQSILSVIVFIYAGQVIWKDILLRSPRAIVHLFCADDNHWQLVERSGIIYSAILLCDSMATAYFCFLRFKIPLLQRKRSCVIFKDAVGPGLYRQLLMKLRSLNITDINKKEE